MRSEFETAFSYKKPTGINLRLLEPVVYPEINGLDRLVDYGYNPEHEANRARALYDELGDIGLQIAQQEQKNNREFYSREFMEDEPVSFPRTYYSFDNKLHSYPLPHQLTSVENGIHPGERDGMTIEGFDRYQKLIAPNGGDNVVVWYSHAGPAGTSEEFKNLYYESGRLYIGVKKDDIASVHIDVKIQEGDSAHFPILDLLNKISGVNTDNLAYYLRNPFTLSTEQELFDRLSQLNTDERRVVYVSRRTEANKMQAHTLAQIIDQLHGALTTHEIEDLSESAPSQEVDWQSLFDTRAIDRRYRGDHRRFMDQQGIDSLVLYGCSTTSVISGPLGDFFASTMTNLKTGFATSSRIDFSQGEKKLPCVKCPFCKHQVDAIIKNNRIHCPREACGKSAPYKK